VNDEISQVVADRDATESGLDDDLSTLDAAALALIPPRLRPKSTIEQSTSAPDAPASDETENSSPTLSDGTFDWASLKPEDTATGLVPENLARAHRAFPAKSEGRRLTVVMADPGDYVAIRNLEARTRMEVLPVQGEPVEILRAIDVHYSAQMPDDVVQALDAKFASGSRQEEGDEIREIPLVREGSSETTDEEETSPIIAAVDSLMQQAVKARATDIHIEPFEDRVRVRFRVDGFLQEITGFPRASHGALLSRLKVLAGMDIAERRRPQDGHFSLKVGNSNLDIRAATADTVHGEMAVLRVLNKSLQLFSLDDLGLKSDPAAAVRQMLGAPNGILLVAGPTGAGKTTTLYAALNELDNRQQNIVTIEDPVEYRFEGVNSLQVSERAGLSFSDILRAVLRLDPDVVLVGEIRDQETARTAVQAALTGHLVLSSVHANDSVRAVSRIIDLGVEPFLLSSALLGVVAQRMVRKVDTNCPALYQPDAGEMAALEELGYESTGGSVELYRGEGCHFCGDTGYHGRTGLFEVLQASDNFRELIMAEAGYMELFNQASADGLLTMKQDGLNKALEGDTTLFEVLRSVHTA
jgi:type II secretory ATPase GspE/PulE/Tfp pilus assembly ATPase PilB-like protein